MDSQQPSFQAQPIQSVTTSTETAYAGDSTQNASKPRLIRAERRRYAPEKKAALHARKNSHRKHNKSSTSIPTDCTIDDVIAYLLKIRSRAPDRKSLGPVNDTCRVPRPSQLSSHTHTSPPNWYPVPHLNAGTPIIPHCSSVYGTRTIDSGPSSGPAGTTLQKGFLVSVLVIGVISAILRHRGDGRYLLLLRVPSHKSLGCIEGRPGTRFGDGTGGTATSRAAE
ncbi:hypothetical protein BCR34DRAFT_670170 [Clohesyomyces aquaticus]|uniref:Uncharacterized protein n=1 Tax=Clohesyomyces aquaticus TaxID=1231657 RepID=A0A1Y1XUW8_9PLEO|nr:hypothetical protein BCR34DRAFT_670170 [Clohesyomyces aquaticus]